MITLRHPLDVSDNCFMGVSNAEERSSLRTAGTSLAMAVDGDEVSRWWKMCSSSSFGSASNGIITVDLTYSGDAGKSAK